MDYKAYALIGILLASVAALASTTAAFAQSTGLTVSTDKDSYQAGETVTISGKVGTVVSGQSVILQVFNPKGAAYRFDPVTVAADGSYTYPLVVGGKLGISGAYQVTVTYNQQQAQTTFQFTGSSGLTWQTATLMLGGQSYTINYMITGGTLSSLSGDASTSTLTANLTATTASVNGGLLTLQIPRNVLDSKQGADGKSGADQEFVVFDDDVQGVVNETTAANSSANATASVRTIQIPFEQATQSIQVVGTFMIPEFGPVAAIVLAIAVVGIIVATTKYTNKFNFLTTRF